MAALLLALLVLPALAAPPALGSVLSRPRRTIDFFPTSFFKAGNSSSRLRNQYNMIININHVITQ
jgi:hypothetical protein